MKKLSKYFQRNLWRNSSGKSEKAPGAVPKHLFRNIYRNSRRGFCLMEPLNESLDIFWISLMSNSWFNYCKSLWRNIKIHEKTVPRKNIGSNSQADQTLNEKYAYLVSTGDFLEMTLFTKNKKKNTFFKIFSQLWNSFNIFVFFYSLMWRNSWKKKLQNDPKKSYFLKKFLKLFLKDFTENCL